MNSYQRVMNTLGGLPADRPPVFAVLGTYGANLTGVDLCTLYSDAAAYVAGQQAVQAAYGFDLVLTGFDYSAISEAFGATTAWSNHQVPNVKRPAAGSAAEAFALPVPDPHRSGRLPVILEATRQLALFYRGEVPVVSALPGPGILPSLIIGLDRWMETLLFDREIALKLLQYSGDFFVAWANALLAAGADCLVLTEGMASAEIVPRELFAELILPHLKQTFDRVDGPKIISSTGGRINPALDLLPGLNGMIGVIAGSKDDLSESRRLLGPDLALIGALDNLAFPAVSAEKIYELSLACLREAAPSGRFILANSGGDIPLATPPENLSAMLGAAAVYSTQKGIPR